MDEDKKTYDVIDEVDLRERMETFYIDYAMSVIASRALPDVRDGLKPVQRRILYAMQELGNFPDKPHRKCARIVGDTMGKFHPHGDSSIYGALVNMAQSWSMRYTLVDGHGNFGSVDGDSAAAMRYTEARLSKISMELMADINKDTVDFVPNFDETEKEPTVMPARFPNLLVNGTTGIAVGMATNIPPHNLKETIDGVIRIIDNKTAGRETSIEEVMDIIKGPDFPTGAMILGRRGINEAYRTGRGKIKVRAVTDIETAPNGRQKIAVTELPYLVNKARLIERIAELVKDKKIDGISDLRDETSREGMRVVIELKKGANANVVLNQLYKHTPLEDTFGVNMLALVNGEPKVLNLLQMLEYYLEHQEDVVARRTRHDLKKAKERAHILEGLLIALDNIDEVIKIIRSSESVAAAKAKLMERFGLSDLQAQAIVDMRLRALTGLEREKIEKEYAELQKLIGELEAILADEKLLLGVVKKELIVVRDKYSDERRTSIGIDDEEITLDDMIKSENTVFALTNLGYIKRMTMDNFRSQNRGGRGIRGITTLDEDQIEKIMLANTHDNILFFTNTGRVFRMKGYRIPEASRTSRGTALVNLLQTGGDERIVAMLPEKTEAEESGKYLIMATKNGLVKKTSYDLYGNIRKNGLIATLLREGDELIDVKVIGKEENIFLITRKGMGIYFSETDVRPSGRASSGVTGIRIAEDDAVTGMITESEGDNILVVTANGRGKQMNMGLFHTQYRGGKGVRYYKVTEKSGQVVGAMSVYPGEELMMITSGGIIIRIPIDSISVQGRAASGVKLISLDEGTSVVSIEKITAEVLQEEAEAAEAEAESSEEAAPEEESPEEDPEE
ncbi:MAG: DNA gyrase subunit A [Lachnospiraceae bacterium]|nr:DNA gyrase subunit A [Lachnospiraceae bacterium]